MATLSVGTRLGPYQVAEYIGAGGMGEVYRGRDTRLGRTVAIKILSGDLAANPARRSRFQREARAISSLTHPHICTLYDVGEADGLAFLVMEHLAGETLADRLGRGPLPIDQALTIAVEIADALATAHRNGIIHRDLKPGNVMLTKAGAKLLDFGLAKLTGEEQDARPQASTWAMPLTGEQVLVGTLRYMAPEQLEGKPPDTRSDLWAFGATVYEMVAGRPAFEGSGGASLVSAILEREPARLSTLQPLTPPGVEWLVRRCLEKAPDDRPDTAHDVATELRWLRDTVDAGPPVVTRASRGRGLAIALLGAGALAMAALGAGVSWLLRGPLPRAAVARVTLDVRPAEELNGGAATASYMLTRGGSRTAFGWTPDGQALVFVGRRDGVQQLYVRPLDAVEARPIPNTEDAQSPAVSLDGRWVAFWARKAIWKVPLAGGPAAEVLPNLDFPPWGLVWDGEERIYVGGGEGGVIWMVRPEGSAQAVTEADHFGRHAHPALLPGGQVLLYTVNRFWTSGEEEVVAQDLVSGERAVILRDASHARYVPTGHLVFLRRGGLLAVPFDADRVEVRGPEVPLLDGVAQSLVAGNAHDVTGAGQFDISSTGTLAWVPGSPQAYPGSKLVTIDWRGQATPLPAPARAYGPMLRISPDGRRLAVCIKTLTETSLWLHDFARGSLVPRNREGQSDWPVWSPDGQQIALVWFAEGSPTLSILIADDVSSPRPLVTGWFIPASWTPDGRQLMTVRSGETADIAGVTLNDETATVQLLTRTAHREIWPELSPDGRWLAYGSNASGRFEVYVRPYPEAGPSEPVSIDGGGNPIWHPNGKELFFVTRGDEAGQMRMMAVDFVPGSPPRIGRPQPRFTFKPSDFMLCTPVRCHDIAPDGQRFYGVQTPVPPPPPVVTQINLIQNWVEELKANVPAR